MNWRIVIWGGLLTVGVISVAAEHLVHDKLMDGTFDGYSYFITPPVPVRVNFTFFEVMNPNEVSNGISRPILQERGPYVFAEHREKRNMTWSGNYPDRPSIKYGVYKSYTFLKELSCPDCNENDTVNIINMPLLSLIGKIHRMGGITGAVALAEIASAAAQEEPFEGMGFEGIVMTVCVRDFLFDGISTNSSGWMIGLRKDEPQESVPYITDRLPITVFDPDNGFALFNHKNDTMENEWYEVETDESDWDLNAMITKWGQQNKLNVETSENNMLSNLYGARAWSWQTNGNAWWNRAADVEGNRYGNNTCNILKGTDGTQFPRGVNKENPLWIFNSAPCRSIFVEHVQEVDVEGIPTYEFTVPEDGLNINKSINVCACENLADYNYNNRYNTDTSCIKRTPSTSDTLDLTDCPPEVTQGCSDGIQDLYYCQGAAVTLSFPHFHLAEEQADYFTGLNPDPEKHRSYLNVEPYSGMTLKLHSRVQLNVPLINSQHLSEGLPFLDTVQDIPNFPVLWIDIGLDVESDPILVEKLISGLVERPTQVVEIGK